MAMLAEVQYRTNVPVTNERQRERTVVGERPKHYGIESGLGGRTSQSLTSQLIPTSLLPISNGGYQQGDRKPVADAWRQNHEKLPG